MRQERLTEFPEYRAEIDHVFTTQIDEWLTSFGHRIGAFSAPYRNAESCRFSEATCAVFLRIDGNPIDRGAPQRGVVVDEGEGFDSLTAKRSQDLAAQIAGSRQYHTIAERRLHAIKCRFL